MKTYKVRYMECYEGTPEIVEATDEKSLRKDLAKWKKKKEAYKGVCHPPAIKIISIKEQN